MKSKPGDRPAYWSLIAPVWRRISIYHGPERFLREFARAPVPGRNLFAAFWCQSEVYNGGFWQFFFNSTGVLAPEAVEGFRAIGMPKTATMVSTAMRQLPWPYERHRERRQDALDRVDHDVLQMVGRQFIVLWRTERGGFEVAANRYAADARSHGSS